MQQFGQSVAKCSTLYFASQNSVLCEAVNPLIRQSAEITYTLCSTRIKTNFRRKNIISYLVCHMEKYHKQDVAPIENENERDESYEASNPQIDSERTRNNYRFTPYFGKTYTEFINGRIKELGLSPRKDAVVRETLLFYRLVSRSLIRSYTSSKLGIVNVSGMCFNTCISFVNSFNPIMS